MRRGVSLCALSILLAACASSEVTRTAENNVDLGRDNVRRIADRATSQDIGDNYQYASQRTKGALIGGTIGAVTGLLSPTTLPFFPATLTGALLGASYGAYVDSQSSLRDKLLNQGAQIVELGDQILIVIPTSYLFDEGCTTIRQSAYPLLKLTTAYINSFYKMLVKVSVYTNDDRPRASQQLVADAEADAVAEGLMAYGVDARVLYAKGYPNQNFVESTKLSFNESMNYRIEITLEKLYV